MGGKSVAVAGEEAIHRERAIVVLGCQPLWADDGRLRGALGRRVQAAYRHFIELPGWLVVSGGRTWSGVVEADAMRDDLLMAGADGLRERCSLSTRDNAHRSRELLLRLGVGEVTIVTCDWHLPRAEESFRREGLPVRGLPVPGPPQGPLGRWRRATREWLSTRVDRVAGGL